MSAFIDPVWIQKKILEDELRLINLCAGHYYISREAKIYSLNMAVPRYIPAIPKLTGEQIIILYTPDLTAYDVSSLVLKTFNPTEAINSSNLLIPCFHDADPSNCHITNLFWGDEKDAEVWRKSAVSRLSQHRVEQLETSESLAIKDDDTPIESAPSMVLKTPVFATFINMIIDTSQRMLSNYSYDDETHFLLRMVVLRFKHVSQLEYLPLENLRSVFDVEAPDPKVSTMLKRFHERFDKIGGTTC